MCQKQLLNTLNHWLNLIVSHHSCAFVSRPYYSVKQVLTMKLWHAKRVLWHNLLSQETLIYIWNFHFCRATLWCKFQQSSPFGSCIKKNLQSFFSNFVSWNADLNIPITFKLSLIYTIMCLQIHILRKFQNINLQ